MKPDMPYYVEHWRTYSGKPRWWVKDSKGSLVSATAGGLSEQRVRDFCDALNDAFFAGVRSMADGSDSGAKK